MSNSPWQLNDRLLKRGASLPETGGKHPARPEPRSPAQRVRNARIRRRQIEALRVRGLASGFGEVAREWCRNSMTWRRWKISSCSSWPKCSLITHGGRHFTSRVARVAMLSIGCVKWPTNIRAIGNGGCWSLSLLLHISPLCCLSALPSLFRWFTLARDYHPINHRGSITHS
jgi:hypothetical protein